MLIALTRPAFLYAKTYWPPTEAISHKHPYACLNLWIQNMLNAFPPVTTSKTMTFSHCWCHAQNIWTDKAIRLQHRKAIRFQDFAASPKHRSWHRKNTHIHCSGVHVTFVFLALTSWHMNSRVVVWHVDIQGRTPSFWLSALPSTLYIA